MANLIAFENLSKAFSEKLLLDGVSGGIETGEKIGVVGINGTGKSTFLRLMTGLLEPDSGSITKSKLVRPMYLPQLPEVTKDENILSYIENWLLAPKPDWEYQAKTLLTKLGILDFERSMLTLSGGERKRVAIAAALTEGHAFMVLDEPTNHLDHATTTWLEELLRKSSAALLMVTHDRYFLDRVATKIFELDGGKLYSYEGNYSAYLEAKTLRLQTEAVQEERRQNLFRRELAWIRRGALARSTKQQARIDRFAVLEQASKHNSNEAIEIQAASSRLGKKTITLQHLSKGFDKKSLFENFSYEFTAGERIGIVGMNGAGKTTLLKLITGELQPDAGIIELGSTVKIGFFSQQSEDLRPDLRIIDHVREVAEYIELPNGEQLTAIRLCELFLFDRGMSYNYVSKLSGGEKRRLQLLKVLMAAPNVLLLDEPTNDLDTLTLTILEDYLLSFPGLVLAVSHDRYFLDKIATSIIAIEEDETFVRTGNYSDYLSFAESKATAKQSAKLVEKPNQTHRRATKKGLSYSEQREFDQMEAEILALEAQLEQLEQELLASSADYLRLQELTLLQESAVQALDQKMERWAELEGKA
ncbi:MAG: ABC-F family ATP-binding cassette domain-containing protein [Clostridia bacterium]